LKLPPPLTGFKGVAAGIGIESRQGGRVSRKKPALQKGFTHRARRAGKLGREGRTTVPVATFA
jgi:hypothetical protein